MTARALFLCLALPAAAAVGVSPVSAQEAPPDRFAGLAPPPLMLEAAPVVGASVTPARDTAASVAFGSFLGSAIGAAAGVLVAQGLLQSGIGPRWNYWGTLLIGYQLGAATGASLGSHLFNGGQGSLALSWLGSSLATTAAAAVGSAVRAEIIFFLAPVAGLIVAPIIELNTTPD